MRTDFIAKILVFASAVFCAAILAGCKDETPTEAVETPIRAIKTVALKTRASAQVRRISGIVEADTVTDLSFEAAGQIVKLSVDVGDSVKRGQILAELDAEPFKLNVETALGEVDQARANLKDAKKKFSQQSTLRQKGFTTKTNLDTATANMEVAESQLKVANTKLSIAKRNLRKTSLVAPFDGRVSEKYVNVFSDVKTGEAIVQMHTEGQLKVEVSVPEGLVRNFKPGDKVSVNFPTLLGVSSDGTIEDIGSRAGAANAFPIKVALDKQIDQLRPGVTAEVLFRFKTSATGSAFVVPNTALLPTGKEGVANVFVYDEKESVVRRRQVKVLNLSGNELEIESDLKDGDIIAVAGVSFLTDGMKVKLWKGK